MQEITPAYLEWLMSPFDDTGPKIAECKSCKKVLDISNFISLVNGTQTKTCYKCKEERRVAGSSNPARVRYLELRQTMPPCVVCGDADISHLEYDHIDPLTKTAELQKMTTVDDLMNELRKCQSLCKKCHRRKTYQHERGAMASRIIKTKAAKIAAIDNTRRFINELKLRIGKCMNKYCSEIVTTDDITFFEFDHINPFDKTMGIGTMVVSNYSMEAITVELQKCQLLCGYCHVEKTTADQLIKIEYYRSLSRPLPAQERKNKMLTMETATEIRRLYDLGSMYQREIADLYSINVETVSRIVRNVVHTDLSYVRARNINQTLSKTLSDEETSEIILLLKNSPKPSIAAIAKQYQCHRDKIVSIAEKNGVDLERTKVKDVNSEIVKYILEAHRNGATNTSLMTQFGLTGRRVKKIIETGSGQVRDSDSRSERNASIKSDYSSGQFTRNQLAKKYNVSTNTINRALK